MREMRVIFKGYVQGVCFRANTRSLALKYGLKGWVANLVDGNVEMLAQGEKETLDFFLIDLKKLFSTNIRETKVSWQNPMRVYEDFFIKA